MDYDTVEKVKEVWKKVDDFDKAYLSTKAVFRGMHKVGMLNDEMHDQVVQEYDKLMMPVNQAIAKAEAFTTEQTARFLWNIGIRKFHEKKEESER